MSDETKQPEKGESTLGNEPTSPWETVTPPAAQPSAQSQAAPVLLPPPAASAAPPPPASGPGGYQQVYDGGTSSGANYGQGYGGAAQGYPTGGANMPPNAPPNYTPPGGYATPPGGYPGQQPPPYGQQGYYPPQGQYNSPNVADMLAAGVLFGRGRRWQRRPRRLIFWPIIIALIVFVSMLHGCMHMFSW